MLWYNNYIKNNLSYDLLIRDPFFIKENFEKTQLSSFFEFNVLLECGLSSVKEMDNYSIILSSLIQELSCGSKAYVFQNKIIGGKKFIYFYGKLSVYNTGLFLDFFFHVIVKSLRRKYIISKYGINNSGRFNFRFQNFMELDLEDYFFFDTHGWTRSFSFSASHLVFKRYVKFNLLMMNSFFKVFNIETFNKTK